MQVLPSVQQTPPEIEHAPMPPFAPTAQKHPPVGELAQVTWKQRHEPLDGQFELAQQVAPWPSVLSHASAFP